MLEHLRLFRLAGTMVVEMEASDDMGRVKAPVIVV